MGRHGLALAKTLVDAANEVVYARVFNPGTSDVTVYKHAHIALFTPVCRIGPVVDVQELSVKLRRRRREIQYQNICVQCSREVAQI